MGRAGAAASRGKPNCDDLATGTLSREERRVSEHEARSSEAPAAHPNPSPPDDDGPFAYRGRWALVTGASMGIGEAFAWALAGRGMHVVLCARSEDRLQALAQAIRAKHGVQTHVVAADLARPGAAAEAWAGSSDGRDIHLLVNNAGFGLHGRFEALPADRQGEMVALNCTAVLELAHLALNAMRPRGRGGIINVASVVAFQPVPWMATYAATKAFVLSLSAALAEENRGSGIRVLCLSPGSTPSGFQATAGTRLRANQPGLLQPREVVDDALDAFDAGKTQVAPGLANRVATTLGRLLPIGTVTRIARRINENRG
jgi:short-subunit dehydrogenase